MVREMEACPRQVQAVAATPLLGSVSQRLRVGMLQLLTRPHWVERQHPRSGVQATAGARRRSGRFADLEVASSPSTPPHCLQPPQLLQRLQRWTVGLLGTRGGSKMAPARCWRPFGCGVYSHCPFHCSHDCPRCPRHCCRCCFHYCHRCCCSRCCCCYCCRLVEGLPPHPGPRPPGGL